MQNEEKLKKFSKEFFGKSMEFLSLMYVETKEEEMAVSYTHLTLPTILLV